MPCLTSISGTIGLEVSSIEVCQRQLEVRPMCVLAATSPGMTTKSPASTTGQPSGRTSEPPTFSILPSLITTTPFLMDAPDIG